MKWPQSYRVKRKQVATDFHQLSRPPSQANKKRFNRLSSTNPQHSKKIIDILSSWWTTQQVVLAHPKYIFTSPSTISRINPPSTFLCHFLPKHLPVHWGHLLNPFLWHQQCPRWLSPVHGLPLRSELRLFQGIYRNLPSLEKKKTKN